MKRLIRASLAAGCGALGILRRAERRARRELTILCYHRVLPAAQKSRYFIPDLVVTPEAFRAHCAVLRDRFDVRPLSTALTAWRQSRGPPKALAAITFDDGYRDNLAYAAPILGEYGLPATFFVITGLVGAAELPWYDLLARAVLAWCARGAGADPAPQAWPELGLDGALAHESDRAQVAREAVARAKRLTPDERRRLLERVAEVVGADAGPGAAEPDADRIMTWQQLAQLAAAGHEIGSHSRTHALLPQLDDAALHEEVSGSRHDLELHLRQPACAFCYPNGDVDERVARAVAAAGYTCAVSLNPGNNGVSADRWRLRRHFIHEQRLCGLSGRTSPRLLRFQLAGLADALLARGVRARWAARNRV